VFPVAFAALLAKTFENISADAEKQVTGHIARHNMQARGAPWLMEGFNMYLKKIVLFVAKVWLVSD
jgi:hypothetical protein